MMMMESSGGGGGDPLLAPGFRFYPTEEELLTFYLRHRLAGTRPVVEHLIPVVDIYGYHPSELQAMAGAANVADTEQWFFFCPRAERELHGGRPARTTPSGYWKATGSPSYVYSSSLSSSSSPAPAAAANNNSSRVIGEKRTMVFYEGRAPTGNKTRWKMNEYKAVVAADDDAGDFAPPAPASGAPIMLRNEFSVCRVYISTGTLRSFDRRPLNLPGGPAVAAQQAVHCGYQHVQQQLQPLPLLATVAATKMMGHHHHQPETKQHQMLATTTENSHNSSSSGSQGGGVMDGAEDAATAIDWDSFISPSPMDDIAFGGVDDLARVIWPHN